MKKIGLGIVILFLVLPVSCKKKGTSPPANIISKKVKDTTPPGEVTNLHITSLDSALKLTWKNPDDPDFAGVLILRREERYPEADTTDGEKVYSGKSTTFTDTNLVNGRPYYYRIFTYDEGGNYSKGVVISGTPRHTYTPSEIPNVTNIQIINGAIIGKIIAKWTKAKGDEEWKYKISISNKNGSWSFSTPETTVTIYKVPFSAISNTLKIQTCTEDFSICNNGTSISFSLPLIEALDRGGIAYSIEGDFPNQEMVMSRAATGVVYTSSSMLIFSTVEKSRDKELFTTIGGGNGDKLLDADGFFDKGNNFLFIHSISTGQNNDTRFLKLFRFTMDLSSEEKHLSTTLVAYGKNTTYTCANFLPPTTSLSMENSAQLIFAAYKKLFITKENGMVNPYEIYSSNLTIAACKGFLNGNGGLDLIIAKNKFYNATSQLGNYDLEILTLRNNKAYPSFQYELQSVKSLHIFADNLIKGAQKIPFILTTYNNSLGKPQLLLFYNDGTTWVTRNFSNKIKGLNSSSLVSADLFTDIITNKAYAALLTRTTSSLFNMNYYVQIIPLSSSGTGVTIATKDSATIFLGTYNLFSYIFIDGLSLTSPNSFYLHLSNYSSKFSWLERYIWDGNSWQKYSFNMAQFGIIRGKDKNVYAIEGSSFYSNGIFQLQKGIPQDLNFTTANSPYSNFGVVFDTSSTPLIGYASSSQKFYVNNNPIYTANSSISYISNPDFIVNLPIFTFWDNNGLFQTNLTSSGWNTKNIAGQSGLCRINKFTKFYAVTVTDQLDKRMFTIFIDNTTRIRYLLWQKNSYIGCNLLPFSVNGTPDHLSILYSNKNLYLTISHHTGTGNQSGQILSDLIVINPLTMGITNSYRIKDDATMAIPIPSFGLTPYQMVIIYYNPLEEEMKYIPMSHCQNGECVDPYPLFKIDLGNSATEIRPYIYFTKEGRTAIEFADKNGRAIRIIP